MKQISWQYSQLLNDSKTINRVICFREKCSYVQHYHASKEALLLHFIGRFPPLNFLCLYMFQHKQIELDPWKDIKIMRPRILIPTWSLIIKSTVATLISWLAFSHLPDLPVHCHYVWFQKVDQMQVKTTLEFMQMKYTMSWIIPRIDPISLGSYKVKRNPKQM